MKLTDDLQVLAATAWGEARGEGEEGIQAVIAVIANRVAIARNRGRYQFGGGGCKALDGDGVWQTIAPASFAAACLMPWQFSAWNANDPNRAKMLELDFDNPDDVLTQCLDGARQAIIGNLADPTDGATFYKTTVLPWPRDWGAPLPPIAVIGRHSFYKLS